MTSDADEPGLRAGTIAALAVAVALVIVFRVVYSCSEELELGDRAVARGDAEVAVDCYRRALRWYVPLSPGSGEAIEKLRHIAVDAERRGDRALALAAERSIRAGIVSSRSFFTPHRRELEAANGEIARLVALEPPPPIEGHRSPGEIASAQRTLLERAPAYRVPGVLVALAGFATWVAAAFLFVQRGLDAEDRVVRHAAVRHASAFVAGFALFLLGLFLA